MEYLRRKIGLVAVFVLLLVVPSLACRGSQHSSGDLDKMAAELLPRLQVLSGLDARAPIHLAWQSRDSMQNFVENQLDEELPAEYIAGTRAAYAAFGLVPDTLDLRKLLLDLYSEQVVGYYDPPTKTLYIVEGAPAGDIRTVLAHELVHALQDQHVNLDSLVSRERGNDRQTAAQAAFEGQATLVMFALMLEEQLGRPITPSQIPPLGSQLQPLVEAQNSRFPVFRSAPRLIRETLLFPYIGGAAFVQALWNAANPDGQNPATAHFPAPIDSLFPESTEQVMYPEQHFIARRDLPTDVDLATGPAEWKVIHEDNLGELETSILLQEHLGTGADSAARGWAGDQYRLIMGPDGHSALIWYSLWDDDAAADRFANAYQQVLQRRPQRRGYVARQEIDGRPVVLVIDAEAALDPATVPVPAVTGLPEY
jgi:hypothetical protein